MVCASSNRIGSLTSLARGSKLALTVFLGIVGCAPQPAEEVTGGLAVEPPMAEEASTAEAKKQAFDYPGGWLNSDSCVDICGVTAESPVERPKAVVCFNPDDAECAEKTGNADYDYLMLSQHWLPTMCLGLDAGYDTTVTHQAGSRCQVEAPSRLTVHGLWPNYNAGFPQCCGSASPLDPRAMQQWPTELQERLQQHQPDPTTSGFEPALCEIFNHEWQKHGTCFIESDDVQAPKRYFETGLDLADRLAAATAQIDAWAGTRQPLASLQALYEHDVQIMCDSRHPDRLLEIHTCWGIDLEQVDCPFSKGFGSLKACGDEIEMPVWEELAELQ